MKLMPVPEPPDEHRHTDVPVVLCWHEWQVLAMAARAGAAKHPHPLVRAHVNDVADRVESQVPDWETIDYAAHPN